MTTTIREQSMEALVTANRVRHARAAVKKGIHAGRYSPLEVLQEPTELIAGMPVRDLLVSVRMLGPKKVDRALARAHIPSNKPIGKLTEHQVWMLDEVLSAHSPWCGALSSGRAQVSV